MNSTDVYTDKPTTEIVPHGPQIWIYGVIVTVLNMVTLLALKRCKHMCVQIRILAMNLAISDVNAGLVCFYTTIVRYIPRTCFTHFLQTIWMSSTVYVTILTVTAMAVDRLFATYWAMKYLTFMTSTKIKLVCLFLWVISLVLATSAVIFGNLDCYGDDIQSSDGRIAYLFFICCVIMLSSYIGIFRNVLMHLRAEKNLNLPMNAYRKTRLTSVIKVTTIVIFFIVNYTPLMLYIIIDMIKPNLFTGINSFLTISIGMAVLNCFINPFLYVWRFEQCRQEVVAMLCFLNKKKITKIRTIMKKNHATYLNDSAATSESA